MITLRDSQAFSCTPPHYNKNVWAGASIIETRPKVTWTMQITISGLYSNYTFGKKYYPASQS